MGLSQVTLDEHGYLTACLPGNQPDAPAIGLIAHMDTADYEAECVVPQIVENYQGGDICLGKGDEVLAIRQYRFLKNYLGPVSYTHLDVYKRQVHRGANHLF